MLYYKNNQWNISNIKVEYSDNDETTVKPIGQEGKQFWLDIVELHEHINIIEFTDIVATDEQIARLEEINKLNIADGYSEVIGDYVINNTFPIEENHILKDLENKNNIKNIQDESIFSMIATIENYEKNLRLEEENINTMVAIIELYEMLGGI